MPNLQACVLAAGKGTRMGGDRPKVLFEANGKPLIEWVLSALSEAGVDDCVAVVGFLKEEVIAKLPTGVRWVEQSPQLGTGHAVRCARVAFPDLAGDILVAYGDMPLIRPGTYRRLVELRRRHDADAAMLTVSVPPESAFGRILRNEAGDVLGVVEYKDATPEQRRIDEGNAGIYCFRPAALWPALEKVRNDNRQGEYYLPDVLPVFLGQGGRVVAERAADPEESFGVNTLEDLAQVEAILQARGKR